MKAWIVKNGWSDGFEGRVNTKRFNARNKAVTEAKARLSGVLMEQRQGNFDAFVQPEHCLILKADITMVGGGKYIIDNVIDVDIIGGIS
jgi:hypothetical protein